MKNINIYYNIYGFMLTLFRLLYCLKIISFLCSANMNKMMKYKTFILLKD